MTIEQTPIRGVIHSFTHTADANGDNQRSRFTIQIVDADVIDQVREAYKEVVTRFNVQAALLPYPPIVDAATGKVDTAHEGIIVFADFRQTAAVPYPYTKDGKTFVSPQEAPAIEDLLQTVGRDVQFLLRLSGTAPREGNDHRRPLPHGAIYCNLRAIAALKTVTEVGTVLDGTQWNTDDFADVEAPLLAQANAEDQAPKAVTDDDIPF